VEQGVAPSCRVNSPKLEICWVTAQSCETTKQMLMRRMRSRRIREPPHQPCFYYCLLHILLAVLLCGQLCLATKNFCGATWGDASEGCATKQPCASGLGESERSGYAPALPPPPPLDLTCCLHGSMNRRRRLCARDCVLGRH